MTVRKLHRPMDATERRLIQQDAANGLSVYTLVKKHKRGENTIKRVLEGTNAEKIASANKALAASASGFPSNLAGNGPEALAAQMVAMFRTACPGIHRLTINFGTGEVEMQVITTIHLGEE